jgi:hypothetical protein
MTKTLREMIQELREDTDLRLLICDWEEYSKNGLIDDCYLRRFAHIYMKQAGMPSHHVVRVMEDIAFESFRRLAGY